ncbi:nucleolar protein 58 isoform X2 [Panulirus ornatus]|uniref:nucleolar protein 58 isoform X2 n=1 Tax=Panulirus ornatus TaxID=150431 RepID=UPI003A864397
MLVLFETSAGFGIFKLLDEKKLQKVDNLFEDFETVEKASKVIQLQDFKKFADSADALEAGVALNEGKICKPLKKLLKTVFAKEAHEQLMVWDAKLGNSIKDKLGIQCVSNNSVGELMRCIKSQVEGLIPGVQEKELTAMSLGLGHNLARYKLKFSPDKVDTMIVQAISLLDDIDKELNNYVMRTREWYGWHFPELSKIITDNRAYIRTVMRMGTRDNAVSTDFSEILPEEIEEDVKAAAEVSMGTEVAEEDILNIHNLCEQVLELTEYRAQLYEYLKNRMIAIAPNLTILVGDLVGARLIAHAGSLINLAKHPASTIQILGAEKALFRALRSRNATPKYGLLYHAQLVSETSLKNKGKMSRMLAAKAALASRYDALGEETTTDMGIENRSKLASRMSMLEQGYSRRITGTGKSMAKFARYEGVSEVKLYSNAADSTIESSRKRGLDTSLEEQPTKRIKVETKEEEPAAQGSSEKKKKKKQEKQKKQKQQQQQQMELKDEADEEGPEEPVVKEEPVAAKPEKKKKKKQQEVKEVPEEPEEQGMSMEVETAEKKKKKKKKQEARKAE